MTTVPIHTLNDGHPLPAIGLGTYRLRDAEGVRAVASAIEVGYRLIDTAVSYENETEVGEGIRASGVDRDELVVTTKVRGRDHGADAAVRSVEESLERLGLEHVDLVLIHWPLPQRDLYVDTWRGLVHLRERGLVRSIGVSNFNPAHLDRLVDEVGVTPAVNQVELHPRFAQEGLRAVHDKMGIRTESWSPLGQRKPPFDEPVIVAAAEAHGVTPAQVVLRWHVQLGSVPIPKSSTPERQAANLDVFGFELTDDEMTAIATLDDPNGRLWGGDPETHEEL
jgi:2,5-diketo-D-gluconate reductase A